MKHITDVFEIKY